MFDTMLNHCKLKMAECMEGTLLIIQNAQAIQDGTILWEDGDLVEIREVDKERGRISVWNCDCSKSQYIYDYEFQHINLLG